MDREQLKYKFRMMLLRLSGLIRPAELKTMLFLLKDTVRTRIREEISTNEELFELLEERHLIKLDDVSKLKQWLHDACPGRKDIQKVIEDFEKARDGQDTDAEPAATFTSATNAGDHSQDILQDEVQFLADHLGREAKHFLRRLGISDSTIEQTEQNHSRNIREVIYRCLGTWVKDQHHQQVSKNEIKRKLMNALEKEKRNDLVKTIKAFV